MSPESRGEKIPCVEQPELEAFDQDGDGVVSFDELRSLLPQNERLQSVVEALRENGVAGIRYKECGDTVTGNDVGANGATEDLATLIARAAVASIYKDGIS